MKLKPLLDRVVLKTVEAEETTKGGIILASAAKEKPSVFDVIEVGPGGNVDGKEVVRLFRSEKNAVGQPLKSLVRFKKISLARGEEAKVEFVLTDEDFTHINEKGEKEYLSDEKFELFVQE